MAPEEKFYRLDYEPDGLVWLAQFSDVLPIAYCHKHQIPIEVGTRPNGKSKLYCPIDKENFPIDDYYNVRQKAALATIFKNQVKDLPVVSIDSEGADVVAKERANLLEEYWIESKLSDTSRGLQLMVQVGRRDGDGKKVQIFIDPGRERVGFDLSDKDKHPAGLFAELTVKFKDSVTRVDTKND